MWFGSEPFAVFRNLRITCGGLVVSRLLKSSHTLLFKVKFNIKIQSMKHKSRAVIPGASLGSLAFPCLHLSQLLQSRLKLMSRLSKGSTLACTCIFDWSLSTPFLRDCYLLGPPVEIFQSYQWESRTALIRNRDGARDPSHSASHQPPFPLPSPQKLLEMCPLQNTRASQSTVGKLLLCCMKGGKVSTPFDKETTVNS